MHKEYALFCFCEISYIMKAQVLYFLLYYLVAVIYDKTILKMVCVNLDIWYFDSWIQNCVQIFSVLRPNLFSPAF
jgi:hypothetical protein